MLLAFEKSLVKFEYHRVLIGFLNNRCIIRIVQTFGSGSFCSVTGSGRLATTHDTATTTCHNFDQMILCFAVLYTIHNDSCIGKSAGYTDLNFHSFVWYREFLDSLVSTYTTLGDFSHCFFTVVRSQTTKNCLCNTTGNTKDNSTAGTESKRHITCFWLKSCKVKAKVVDHTKKLCGCDNDIGIFFTMCIAVRTNSFCLLSRTWHNGNHYSLLSLSMFRITEVFLNNSRKHSLWGSAGRNIRNIILILICNKFHPCRTAGCQERKFLTFFNTVKEFCTFFHNRKVSTECGIINFIKSHAMKRIDDLAHYTAALLESVMIAHCNTYCRCNLRNYTDIRICKCLKDFVCIRVDGNSSCRTECTALSTVYALCLCNLFIECRHNHCFCSTECKSKCADSLNFLAGTYTVSAEDTFIRIANDRRRTEIQFMLLSCVLETYGSYTKTMCQFLKDTLTTLDTCRTVTTVCCKKQFHDQFTIVS